MVSVLGRKCFLDRLTRKFLPATLCSTPFWICNHMPLSRAIDARSRSMLHLQDGSTRYPGLGIAGTCIGTLVALSLIPEDPQPQGALFQSALAMTAGLAAAPVAAAFKDPKSLLRGEHLLALSPVYWLLLDLLQGAYPMNSIEPVAGSDRLHRNRCLRRRGMDRCASTAMGRSCHGRSVPIR